jgi:tRNA pseudouridine55 synthase
MRRGFFLPVIKPFGMTSSRAVQIVKREVVKHGELGRKVKVGHAGTLDPRATGVLTVAVGRATRFIRFLRTEKRYTATFRIGVETDSDDLEGVVTRECAAPWVTRSRCEDVLTGFIGEQGQVPPIFSAIRLDGARAYALARSGRSDASEAEALRERLAPRPITIYSIDVLDWRGGDFPEVDVAIDCSRGTYIRSIARDFGRALVDGGGAPAGCTLAALERTQCGAFTVDGASALAPIDVERDALRGALAADAVASIDDAMAHLRSVRLAPGKARDLRRGDAVEWWNALDADLPSGASSVAAAAATAAGAAGAERGGGERAVRVVNTADERVHAVACVRRARVEALVKA